VRLPNPVFPDPDQIVTDDTGLLGWGGNLEVTTLVEAYSKGIFPWAGRQPIPWYCPDPRLVLYPQDLHVSRSLRKLERQARLVVRYDRAFRRVMEACAQSPRPGQDGTWISPEMVDAYEQLHQLGIAHSVEVYDAAGQLVGGLYGLSLSVAFFGESMFFRAPNASKMALARLCQDLLARSFHFIDCQQETPHLQSLGAVSISRRDYLDRLAAALRHRPHHYSWSIWDEERAG
jgi:leucyl/phenylalanyl-tRNA---protein transferase